MSTAPDDKRHARAGSLIAGVIAATTGIGTGMAMQARTETTVHAHDVRLQRIEGIVDTRGERLTRLETRADGADRNVELVQRRLDSLDAKLDRVIGLLGGRR